VGILSPAVPASEVTVNDVLRSFMGVLVFSLAVSTMAAPENGNIEVTILYDDYVATEGVQSDWGYSCLIEGTEETILFDAGTKADILFHNIDVVKANIGGVGLVVISHEHGDHTGGLERTLRHTAGVSVYHPVSFSKGLVASVAKANARAVPVKELVEICKNVFLIGEMGDGIRETSWFSVDSIS
jgi:7,8-dihydropterin-6-yl-methyl-4-(beta-D-ribofuranosyl)aminobenzene 5'-phosphate synthase